MVQTPKGAGGNPWITYMRACASNYHAGVSQKMSKHTTKPKETPKVTPKVVTKVNTKEKPAKIMDAKDVNRLNKVVKAAGEASAKAKVKESKKK
jgi:hypothetical protein